VGELAYLLGFSTHAAFHKAFRRWTNETPGDFRRRSLCH
jgi:AraC-like DNA-binding protein